MTDFLDSLTHGLKTDNFVADFLCNDIRLAGIISTRSNMLIKAKSRGIMAKKLFND
ncbi:glycerol-3-phosphate responsive antiterminator [Lysinibacillus xylanilyticus]|uniref:glycerol-3-phosphate responsive antiterminator n=1 Tax=Lysinibacillus xylanilyticus TaxID=582475 RepID=UPI0037FD1A6C